MSISRQEIEETLARLLPDLEEKNRILEARLAAEKRSAHAIITSAKQIENILILMIIAAFYSYINSKLKSIQGEIAKNENELAEIDEKALTGRLDDIDEKYVPKLKALTDTLLARPDHGIDLTVNAKKRKRKKQPDDKTPQQEAESLEQYIEFFITGDQQFVEQYQATKEAEQKVIELKAAWDRLCEEKETCDLLEKIKQQIQLTEDHHAARVKEAQTVWRSFNTILESVKFSGDLKIQSDAPKQQSQTDKLAPLEIKQCLEEIKQQSQQISKRFKVQSLSAFQAHLASELVVASRNIDTRTQKLKNKIKNYNDERENKYSGKGQKPNLPSPTSLFREGGLILSLWIALSCLTFIVSPLAGLILLAPLAVTFLPPVFLNFRGAIRRNERNNNLQAYDKDEGEKSVLEKQNDEIKNGIHTYGISFKRERETGLFTSSASRKQRMALMRDGIFLLRNIVSKDEKLIQVRYHNIKPHKNHFQLKVNPHETPCKLKLKEKWYDRSGALYDFSGAPLFWHEQKKMAYLKSVNANGEEEVEVLKETHEERVEQYKRHCTAK